MKGPLYSVEDCLKVIEFFQNAPKNKKVSYNLVRTTTTKDILYDFQVAYTEYAFDKARAEAPTKKQFLQELATIQSNARKLEDRLVKSKTHHLYGVLISSEMEGIDPIKSKGEDLESAFQAVSQHIISILSELTWLIEATEPFLSGKFSYELLRDPVDKKEPETKFIINLSNILTKHFFETGGYSKSQSHEDGASGWHIHAIKYLLGKAGVKKTMKQVYDAIA